MTLFIKPQNGEELRNANVIIGYLDGMAIIENEYGKRFLWSVNRSKCRSVHM